MKMVNVMLYCYSGGERMSRLGDLVKARRNSMDLSLRDFAKLYGFSHSYIKKLEGGDPRNNKDVTPRLSTMGRIAEMLDTTVQELLKETGFVDSGSKIYLNAFPRHMKQDLKSFIAEPSNEQYLILAKELKEKNIQVDFLRKTILDK
jgi:transcriptional regulator with XRE-family HTH domain